MQEEKLILSEEEKTDMIALGFSDPVFHCKFYFPHLFLKDIPWLHRGILAILTRKTDFLLKYGELDKIFSHFIYKVNGEEKPIFTPIYKDGEIVKINLVASKYCVITLPRGFAKTTLVGLGVISYLILYQECKFPLYVSETAGHANTQLRNLRDELQYNERIQLVFGTLAPDRNSTLKWTDDFFQTTTGISCAARGRGGQVRGLNVKGQRPDRVIGDDIEDLDSVSTEEQRAKAKKWFYGALKPVLPKMDKNASIYMLGTLLHFESLLARLQHDMDWCSVSFGAIDKDGEALWKDNMTLEDIEKEKQSYARQGELSTFYLEYMSEIKDVATQLIKPGSIIYKPHTKDDCIARAIAIDPAISSKSTADFVAFGVVGMTPRGVLPVLDSYVALGMSVREQVDKYFELAIKWDCNKYGVESVAFQTALIHLLKEEMFRKKRYFEITPITHSNRQKKIPRIKGILQARYASGYIVHNKVFPELESQLYDFPNGKVDAPDALAMAITLLDPYAAAAADPEIDLGDDEYPPLEEELGEWRTV